MMRSRTRAARNRMVYLISCDMLLKNSDLLQLANSKGTSGSIYHTLGRGGRGSLKSLPKFLEVKNFKKSAVNMSLEISSEVP
jgi:hypothetical protein